MRSHRDDWKAVKRPWTMTVKKGWRWTRAALCLVSPRGTVFETRLTRAGLFARKRREFQLKES